RRSSRSDDGSSPRIHLNQPFVYFGQSYSQIYVNHNGHLTFTGPWRSFTPQRFPINGSRDVIAPFWTDIDNRERGQILYKEHRSGHILQQATQDVNQYFPGLNFRAVSVFVATWHEVAYFPETSTVTTFQAVLISGGRYSFVLMNYGAIDRTTHSIQIGYDTVHSAHHHSIPFYFGTDADGRVFQQRSNVNVPGRFAFRTDTGTSGPLYLINGRRSPQSDDGSSPRIHLNQPFVYFGQSYSQIYVNHNGHLTFTGPWRSSTPQCFPMQGSRDIIAPFWTDIDNRLRGRILYKEHRSGHILQQATQDVNQYFPGLNFRAVSVFVATWHKVAYYPRTSTVTTFQAVLISGGRYSFVLMNYGEIDRTTHSIQVRYKQIQYLIKCIF
uniref:NIDO domain-containing protein n=1 Tax=Salarias fasciatus TaxID=181472 RepID=A0A672IDG3_SALFA